MEILFLFFFNFSIHGFQNEQSYMRIYFLEIISLND